MKKWTKKSRMQERESELNIRCIGWFSLSFLNQLTLLFCFVFSTLGFCFLKQFGFVQWGICAMYILYHLFSELQG